VHRNFYTHRPPKQVREEDVMVCQCRVGADGKGCGDECLNRTLFYECDPRFCPCRDACQNQRFQRRAYAKLGMCRAGRKGHGLCAGEAVAKGSFLTEYVGEVLEESVYAARKATYTAAGQRHFYFMTLSGGEVIDARVRGNLARFTNHSCSPNCETQKWMVNGELCIGLFTLRDVREGDELTFDYNFERYGDRPMRCLCGAKNCRGWVGGKGDGEAPSDEEEEAEEEEPDPVMLASDGRELEVFRRAEAQALQEEAERSLRRERERADRMARRKAAEEKQGRKSGGGASRRAAPAATLVFVRRSEVERRLDEMLAPHGGVRSREYVRPLLRLFHVALAGEAGRGAGAAPVVSTRDLSMLLGAVANTQAPSLQRELLDAGVPGVLHMALPRLVGAELQLPVLRALLRALDGLPFSLQLLRATTSAKGTLLDALGALERSTDAEVARRARELCTRGAPAHHAAAGAYPPPPPPPYSDERLAKRARPTEESWRAPPLPSAALAPPLPSAPPAAPVSMMDLAPVHSPTRGQPAELHPAPTAAAGSIAAPAAPPSVIYAPNTAVPWPTKEEVGRLPESWEDPCGDAFRAGVLILVAYRLGKYRQAEHPLSRVVRPVADVMALKLATKVVDRERRKVEQAKGRPAGVQRAALSSKIKSYVTEHVHVAYGSAGK